MAMRTQSPDLVVLGGGIIGLSCAWALARRGLQVQILERGPLPGEQPRVTLANQQAATWASAGMLAPLAEVPTPGPFFEVCRRSRDLWPTWAATLSDAAELDVDYGTVGTVLIDDLIDDPAPVSPPSDFLTRMRQAASAAGEAHASWDHDQLAAAIPDLAEGLSSALVLPHEHRVDNRRVHRALTLAAQRAGVEILANTAITAVRAQAGGFELHAGHTRFQAPRLLLTAGAWSGQIAGLPPLPVRPVRGQMVMLGEVDWPFLGTVRGEHGYAVRRNDGRLLVGATTEEAGFACTPTPQGLASLLHWLQRVFPGLAHRPILETWAGLRPATPDHHPLIGEMAPNLWVASGHFRNGILLAPWTAQIVAAVVAAAVAGAEPELDSLDHQALTLFAPLRFAKKSEHGLMPGKPLI